MWLFTKYGFFSVVCARKASGRGPVDPALVMVRSRDRRHLEALLVRFPELLGGLTVREGVGTDYRFRLLIKKGDWAEVLSSLGEELDFDNFKEEAERVHGPRSTYVDLLHRVWGLAKFGS
jgi:hypothetical protein